MRNPLDPKNFKPQPLRYTGKWNTSNGLHGKKVRVCSCVGVCRWIQIPLPLYEYTRPSLFVYGKIEHLQRSSWQKNCVCVCVWVCLCACVCMCAYIYAHTAETSTKKAFLQHFSTACIGNQVCLCVSVCLRVYPYVVRSPWLLLQHECSALLFQPAHSLPPPPTPINTKTHMHF